MKDTSKLDQQATPHVPAAQLRRPAHARRRLSTQGLTSLDVRICEHLLQHRVLTTPQLVVLTQRPERTVRYRLESLRRGGSLGRSRPAAPVGSAPAHWWLTAKGMRSISASSPALAKATPRPLFMAHTVAIADLYAALLRLQDRSGTRVRGWERDQDSWEEWRGRSDRRSLCPDALLQAELDVDGQLGVAEAFIEIDLGTMTQARLQAKATRFREYVADDAWRDLHPRPPLLLILTISEARAHTFLRGLRAKPRRSVWSHQAAEDDNAMLAICSCARGPDAAVLAPVWRTTAEGKPQPLRDLLTAAVRAERVECARAAEAAADEARDAPVRALGHLLRDLTPEDLDDEQAAPVVRLAQDLLRWQSAVQMRAWADAHAALLLDVDAWWRSWYGHRFSRWTRPPEHVIAGLRALHPELWRIEVDRVLSIAQRRSEDRRLPIVAHGLAAGHLVEWQRIDDLERSVDWDAEERHARDTYVRVRRDAVANQLHQRPWYRRGESARLDLTAVWDAEHLVECTGCRLQRRREPGVDRCPACSCALIDWRQAMPLTPLAESLLRLRRLCVSVSA